MYSTTFGHLALTLALAGACDRSHAPASEQAERQPARRTNTGAQSEVLAAPAAVPSVRTRNRAAPNPQAGTGSWSTCFSGFRGSGPPERDVTRLGAMCGPSNSMQAVGSQWRGELKSVEQPVARELPLAAEDCVRVFVAAEGVEDVEIDLLDPQGESLATTNMGQRWAVLEPETPVCVSAKGTYSLELRAHSGAGHFAAQVYRSIRLDR